MDEFKHYLQAVSEAYRTHVITTIISTVTPLHEIKGINVYLLEGQFFTIDTKLNIEFHNTEEIAVDYCLDKI